jgi:hypothetical protein
VERRLYLRRGAASAAARLGLAPYACNCACNCACIRDIPALSPGGHTCWTASSDAGPFCTIDTSSQQNTTNLTIRVP